MWKLFGLVFSLAATAYGGGGAMLMAGLERELVQSGQISAEEFSAAIALGQSTPGPLAPFIGTIGLLLEGAGGAVVAVSALMILSLLLVAVAFRVPTHWFHSPLVRRSLSLMMPLSVALLLFLTVRLSLVRPVELAGVAIAVGVIAGRRLKIPAPVLILVAVGVGMFGMFGM